jgi:hypothetical protein
VDTIGFNASTWLDRLGRPHSDALHVVERIRRTGGALSYEVVVDDPKAYAAPWRGTLRFEQRPGWALLEHTCVAREDGRYRSYRDRAWQAK